MNNIYRFFENDLISRRFKILGTTQKARFELELASYYDVRKASNLPNWLFDASRMNTYWSVLQSFLKFSVSDFESLYQGTAFHGITIASEELNNDTNVEQSYIIASEQFWILWPDYMESLAQLETSHGKNDIVDCNSLAMMILETIQLGNHNILL